MERWSGRVAMVTGASAGIGEAIAKELVLKGMKVVGVARRLEKLEALSAALGNAPGKLYPLKCDVSKEAEILAAFEWVKKNLGGVDVLVNNAGVIHDSKLSEGETESWRHILEVNVLGMTICSREAIKHMKERPAKDGHIININSVAGHHVIHNFPGLAMYNASKYAVTALTEGLKYELMDDTKIKTTSLSPGLVRTEIMDAGNMKVRDVIFEELPSLHAKDIADALVFVLATPAHVQIPELTITPFGDRY